MLTRGQGVVKEAGSKREDETSGYVASHDLCKFLCDITDQCVASVLGRFFVQIIQQRQDFFVRRNIAHRISVMLITYFTFFVNHHEGWHATQF